MATLSDNLLLERVGQGDSASFETLFYRHYDRIYGLLFRLVGNRAEAEDLTQEVFVRLYQHAAGIKRPFSPRREHNLSAWLYRVATNAGYNAVRGRNRRWRRRQDLAPQMLETVPGPRNIDQIAEQRETEAMVRAALLRLPQRQAQLLLLRQMGFSYAECAVACDVAPGSIGTLLARATRAFRVAYKEVAKE